MVVLVEVVVVVLVEVVVVVLTEIETLPVIPEVAPVTTIW